MFGWIPAAALRRVPSLLPPSCGTQPRYAASAAGKKIAIVLSGCGVYDGSEIQESVFVLSQVVARGGRYKCFAPDKPMMHVIDHTSGSEMSEQRNCLKESARIARGDCQPLSELSASAFDAVVFPGGFGVAKNLSDFAVEGPGMEVDEEVVRVIKEFREADKPMGVCCIAPVLPAKVLGHGVEVTIGSDVQSEEWPYAGTADTIASLGGTHVIKQLTETHVDATNKIVSSPAYMNNKEPITEIETSVRAMVDGVVDLL